MAQEQVQIQEQKQQQVQRLSQQQMLQVKLLEMPLTELEESINAELDDNPALEKGREDGEQFEETKRAITTISMFNKNNKSDKMHLIQHSNVWEATTNCPFTMGDNATIMPTTRR